MRNMLNFEAEPFEFDMEFDEYEEEFPASRLPARAASRRGSLAKKTSFRYVKDFSGPAAECSDALKKAGKTRAEALTIINTQIGVAIAMLRKASTSLKRGSRSSGTKTLFRKIFRVKPEFVPTWLKSTAAIKDRGDVVATRCKRVADLLASGAIKFFCTINSTNCPDCSNDSSDFACSSWGDESKAPKNSRVVCLGDAFWNDMKAGKTDSLLATLMHEPFHIYYGIYVTEHRSDAGKFGGINCIVQFVFETNSRTAPARVNERCRDMAVRREIGELEQPLNFEAEPFELDSEFDEYEESAEFEATPQRRWFYLDAYWLRANGEWQFLEKVGPVLETRDFGEKMRSTLRIKWHQRTVAREGGSLHIRCLVWNGKKWLDCRNYYF